MKTEAMEILAPVGGQEQLLAAVRSGADAVYLGTKGFNARQNAENFAETSLADAVSYCHARNVKVYVTVNTLITDDEVSALVDTLREIAASGADAAIVQDMAVARLIQHHCPTLEMHASTQMTIHNAAGARMLASLGFARAVLARELTLDEIRAIHEACPSLALEVFVHGALCMSVSGACYLSSMLGGRSGNRGRCAQPCRLDFKSDGRGFALSLKDLSALGHMDALAAAGVHSLKIEGRMKRPEYVAAAVTATRKACAHEPYDLQTLEDVFSRGGFTDGYLTGKRNLTMYGTRGQAEVQASQRAQKQLTSLYQREYPAVAVDMTLTLENNIPSALVVADGTHSLSVNGDIPQQAEVAATDHDRAWRSLSKTGESPFFLRSLTLHTDGALMLPASALNNLRREALSRLLALREAPAPKAFVEQPLAMPAPHQAAAVPSIRVRFQHAAQCWLDNDAEQIILPIGEITDAHIHAFGQRLIGEIPALVFPGQEARMLALLQAQAEMGLRGVLCNNLGAIGMAKAAGLSPYGGYGLNILNTLALDTYAALGLIDATLSFELHAQKIRRIGGTLPRGILAYGYLPLMQLRNCPAQGANGCGSCTGTQPLTDRTGASFPLLCTNRQYTTLLNSLPLSLAGESMQGVDFKALYFTTEPPEACCEIYGAFRAEKALDINRTRGLYYRTLQ